MKRVIVVSLLLGIIFSCSSRAGFIISGKIDKANDQTIFLKKRIDKSFTVVDSAIIKNGNFTLTGRVKYPELHYLEIPQSGEGIMIFIENSKITIAGSSLEEADISGSQTHNEYRSYLDLIAPFEEKLAIIYQEYPLAAEEGNKTKLDQLHTEYLKLTEEELAVQKLYVINNSASYVTPTILSFISIDLETDELADILGRLPEKMAVLPIVLELQQQLLALRNTEIGQPAPDFTLNDPAGNPIQLSDKIGTKLLLLDFWASWCNPCRQENPNVVAVYQMFKTKGFDVFGVSLDKDKDNWQKAIADDKLTWTQVSQLEGWSSTAAEKYAVMSIPANFLIDENGIIIAKNLRGEELEKKVKEILGE